MNNNFVIIIEGQDRTGKDTLIKKLVKTYFDKSPFIIHCIGTDKKDSEGLKASKKYYYDLFNLIESSNNNFILNRSHIGEYIYSPIYRGYSGDYIFELEKTLSNKKNYFLIGLIDSSAEALKREDSESLSKGSQDLFFKEQNLFTNAILKSRLPNSKKILLDIKDKNEDVVFNIIKNNFIGDQL